MVVVMSKVLVLVTSMVLTGSPLASTVTVTFSTSVVVTVRLEHVAGLGVAWCLMATGVTVTLSYSYFVDVTVLRWHTDSAKARLARGKRLRMVDFMVSVV